MIDMIYPSTIVNLSLGTALGLLLSASEVKADILDRIDFGNRKSEVVHNTNGQGAELVDYSRLPEPDVRIKKVSASVNETAAINTIDGDIISRWGESGHGEVWVQYELNDVVDLDHVKIALAAPRRKFPVEIKISIDGENWQQVYKGRCSEEYDGKMETFTFDPEPARYVRVVVGRGIGAHGGETWIKQVRLGSLQFPDAYARAATPNSLGHTGRRLLARKNVDYEMDGENWMDGWMMFDIKVEPNRQNYITLKLWGSETFSGRLGLLLDNNKKSYAWIDKNLWRASWEGGAQRFAGRWIYRTYPLPKEEVTKGKKKVRLRLQKIDGGADFPPVYSVYSHTDPCFEPPPDEPQGEPFEWGKVHGKPDEEKLEKELKQKAERRVEKVMNNKSRNLDLLSKIYNAEWSEAYRDKRLVKWAAEVLDDKANEYAKNGSLGMRWAGPGRVYAKPYSNMHDGFQRAGLLQKKIDFGEHKKVSRREAYTRMFKGEFDKFHMKRRSYTNQAYYGNAGLYYLNRAVLQLAPEKAVAPKKSRRFVKEILGMSSFAADGGSGGNTKWRVEAAKAGFPVHVVTDKGLTRERGYVHGYGEMTGHFADMAGEIGAPVLKKRVAQTIHARVHFRIPGKTVDGYRTFRGIGVLSWRGNPYPDGQKYLPNLLQTAAVIQDPVSARMVELYLEHHGRLPDGDPISMYSDYRVYKSLPESNYRLPVEPEHDDYAWADEENGIFMVRRGDDMIWGSFYMGHGGIGHYAVKSQGRIRHATPRNDRIVDVVTEARVPEIEDYYEVDYSIDEEGHTSVFGEKQYPVPEPPPGTDWPSRELRKGRALFYQVHYGDYVIAMNTTEKGTYRESEFELKEPSTLDFRVSEAVDLVSGEIVDLTKPIILGPHTTMVLYLGDE